jgi:hypothetical protein
MEVSSTSMNVAMVTVSAMSQGLNFGFQGAWIGIATAAAISVY